MKGKKQGDKEGGKVKLWQERLRKNEAAMRAEHEMMEKRADLYNGTRSIEKTPDATSTGAAKKASSVRNIVAELVESQVSTNFGLPKVTARREAHEELARIAEDFLIDETDRLPFEVMNDLDERITPIQGGDYFFVEWDSDRHTHDTSGELCVSLLHPRQVILQDGINDINDMDFVIVQVAMTKKHVQEKYKVSVENEQEEEPASRGGRSSADDVVTVNFGYFRNKNGGIGRYTWVNDVELEDLEDYQARKMKKCKTCGGNMTGLDTCPYCGGTKAEESDSEYFEPFEDLPRSEKFGGPIPMYEDVWEYPEGVENGIIMDPLTGEAYEAQPERVSRARKIPYYKPDIYPIVPRKNVSAWGKVLGDSDVDKIADQQNTIKKCDTRIQEKLDKGGSVLTKSKNTKFEKTDAELKILNMDNPAEMQMFSVQNLQVNTNFDQAAAEDAYEQARRTLGITDSFQGRPDRTATSGVAKQIAVQQSAGRLESKKVMKNAAYADLYQVMFKFLLAYSDEPRDVRHKNADGSTTYGKFNKYDFLAQDDAGEWYWIDDFLFSVDNASSMAGNREAMWQETRMNLRDGAFGNPNDLRTLIMFWGMMARQHYPFATETKEMLEQQLQEEQAQMQQMQMLQAGMPGSGLAPVNMTGGMGNGM